MQLTTKQQYWLNHITAAKQSKQAMSAYAVQHNLCVKALYSWKWQLKQLNIPTAKKRKSFYTNNCSQHSSRNYHRCRCKSNASQWHIATTATAHHTNTHHVAWRMMAFTQPAAVYLHVMPIDFRKQINGLSLLVQDAMLLDVFFQFAVCFYESPTNAH